jgi:hypothetical protein
MSDSFIAIDPVGFDRLCVVGPDGAVQQVEPTKRFVSVWPGEIAVESDSAHRGDWSIVPGQELFNNQG